MKGGVCVRRWGSSRQSGGAVGSREAQLIVALDVQQVRELSIRFHRKQIAN